MIRVAVFAALLLLAGCASGPGIPESTYYRLPPPSPTPPPAAEPVYPVPLVVETLLADGLHSSQALLYAMDDGGQVLRAYHYQLWVDPPVRMLQRRLMERLARAGIAPLVVDRLDARASAVRISGRIEHFERIPQGDGWRVAVGLRLRADAPGQDQPLLVRSYREDRPADGADIAASVRAIGVAVDAVFAAFAADLAAARQP